jgi:hypothetical protein
MESILLIKSVLSASTKRWNISAGAGACREILDVTLTDTSKRNSRISFSQFSKINLVLPVFFITFVAMGLAGRADALSIPPIPRGTGIPVAVTTCTCSSYTDLKSAAVAYMKQWRGKTPPGYAQKFVAAGDVPLNGATQLVVASDNLPISGVFYYGPIVGRTGLYDAFSLSGLTNTEAIATDTKLFARSAKGRVTTPGSIPLNGTTPEIIGAWLGSSEGVPQTGPSTVSLWHAVTNFPQILQGTFTNFATGETFTLWNGDVITVIDSNGWTAQFQWTPLSTIQWALLPDSIRDQNGNPIGVPPPTASPGARQPGGARAVGSTNANMPPRTVTAWYNTTPTVTPVITVGTSTTIFSSNHNCVGGHCR